MNKNILGSKLISGGGGIDSLDIKSRLKTKDLVVTGNITIPANSLTIPEVSNLQDSLNSITPLINAKTDTITNLQQATTNITYGNGYTNIPNLYMGNDLLLYDHSSSSNIDVVPTLNSLSRNTSGITVDGSGKTNIVELSVSNKLTVYDPVGGYKDIIYTLDSQEEEITVVL